MEMVECFNGIVPQNSGLVKFRDVKVDDVSVLFYFLSILLE